MLLYVLRHGIAFERDEWDGDDDSRPLTDDGKSRTREVVKALQKAGKLEMDAIWSSPLVRARQTAEIAGKVLGLQVAIVDELASGTALQRLMAAFEKRKPLPEKLMLVGHEPDCGEIIGGLAGREHEDFSLKKAGMALLDGKFEPGGMKLKWLLAPAEVLK